mgnify:CR=1 FL=1
MRKPTQLIALLVLLALVVTACSPSTEERTGGSESEVKPLTIALLPIVDSLPFLVARDKGYFAEAGVEVDLQFFQSALEADSAFQARAVDGAISDLIRAAVLKKSLGLQVLSISQGVTPEEGPFAILVPPGSDIDKVDELRGVEIAISPNSIIEFTTDQMLREAGFRPEEIKKTIVTSIPQRLELLLSGQIKAATLPDPLATLAETKGARRILDDTQGANISQSVILFTEEAIENNPEAIRRFFKAYRKAVADIQADPEAYRPLLEAELRLPKNLKEYTIGPFSMPQVPQRADVERVVNWLVEKGILDEPIEYEDLVNDEFVAQ